MKSGIANECRVKCSAGVKLEPPLCLPDWATGLHEPAAALPKWRPAAETDLRAVASGSSETSLLLLSSLTIATTILLLH
jgi:hypothetical protein